METLYLLIPVSVVLVFLVGIAFWWSLKSGQFDDLDGPAYRVLMDDDQGRNAAAKSPTAAPAPPAGPPESSVPRSSESGAESGSSGKVGPV